MYLEQHPQRIGDDPGTLFTAIGNKIGLLLAQKQWQETESLIRQMRDLSSRYSLTADR